MTDDIGPVRAKLIEILGDAPNGLQGAKLAQRLRAALVDFSPANHGARNIKEFIELNVPELSVIGKAGADVIYALKTQLARAEAIPATRSPCVTTRTVVECPPQLPLWSVWATPTTSFVIDIDADGNATVVSANSAMHRRLNPLAPERHREIAKSFLSRHETTIGQDQLERLKSAVELPPNTWWASWLKAIKADVTTNAIWLPFRRELLQKFLEDEVRSLGLSTEAAARAVRSISASRRSQQSSNISTKSDTHTVNPGQGLRQIVLEAINTLDESSLREIRLPVGLIFDIIKSGIR